MMSANRTSLPWLARAYHDESTNARELFAREKIEQTRRSQPPPKRHPAVAFTRCMCDYISDALRLRPASLTAYYHKRPVNITFRNERDHPAFASYIQRIETKKLTCATHHVTYGHPSLIDFNIDCAI